MTNCEQILSKLSYQIFLLLAMETLFVRLTSPILFVPRGT